MRNDRYLTQKSEVKIQKLNTDHFLIFTLKIHFLQKFNLTDIYDLFDLSPSLNLLIFAP